MITNQIVEAYIKIHDEFYSNNPWDKFETVLRMSPKGFNMFMAERYETHYGHTLFNDGCGNQWAEIYGAPTPIVIDERIPEDILFMIQSREEYEKQERRELEEKIIRMFGGYKYEWEI